MDEERWAFTGNQHCKCYSPAIGRLSGRGGVGGAQLKAEIDPGRVAEEGSPHRPNPGLDGIGLIYHFIEVPDIAAGLPGVRLTDNSWSINGWSREFGVVAVNMVGLNAKAAFRMASSLQSGTQVTMSKIWEAVTQVVSHLTA